MKTRTVMIWLLVSSVVLTGLFAFYQAKIISTQANIITVMTQAIDLAEVTSGEIRVRRSYMKDQYTSGEMLQISVVYVGLVPGKVGQAIDANYLVYPNRRVERVAYLISGGPRQFVEGCNAFDMGGSNPCR